MIGKPGIAAGPLLLLVNAGRDDLSYILPPGRWQVALDTSLPTGCPPAPKRADTAFALQARSVVLLAPEGSTLLP